MSNEQARLSIHASAASSPAAMKDGKPASPSSTTAVGEQRVDDDGDIDSSVSLSSSENQYSMKKDKTVEEVCYVSGV